MYPGLALHELGVVGPGLDQRGLVLLFEGEKIDEHDRARFEIELAVDGKSRVHGAKLHDGSPNWFYDAFMT